MKLIALWRRANPSQSKCQKCGSTLSVRCVRPPSEGCVNGQFLVAPCGPCDQSRAAKKRRSDRVKSLAPWLRDHSGNLSALHRRFREGLCLEALGFVSEQQVGPYRVDELNAARKIIVEINGDVVHANPSKYRARDTIVTARGTYTAREKWEADAKRIAALEALGYWVLVVWQGDGYEKARDALWEIIRAQDG